MGLGTYVCKYICMYACSYIYIQIYIYKNLTTIMNVEVHIYV